MPTIHLTVRNRVAHTDDRYICGNGDFTMECSFDEEWDAYDTKTARFVKQNGKFEEKVFSGTSCSVPKMINTDFVHVGVYAGDLYCTTPATVWCDRGILCEGGLHEDPPEDVYNQIMEKLNNLEGGGGGSTQGVGIDTIEIMEV